MDEIDHDDERDNINRRKSKFPKCSFCGMFSQMAGIKCPFCGKGVVR
jgi:hypothetical protein